MCVCVCASGYVRPSGEIMCGGSGGSVAVRGDACLSVVLCCLHALGARS